MSSNSFNRGSLMGVVAAICAARARPKPPPVPPPSPEALVQLILQRIPDGLTRRQKAFILAYPVCTWCASRAALLAGYSPKHPRQSGHQTMRSPRVRKAIRKVNDRLQVMMQRSHIGQREFELRYGPALREAIDGLVGREL